MISAKENYISVQIMLVKIQPPPRKWSPLCTHIVTSTFFSLPCPDAPPFPTPTLPVVGFCVSALFLSLRCLLCHSLTYSPQATRSLISHNKRRSKEILYMPLSPLCFSFFLFCSYFGRLRGSILPARGFSVTVFLASSPSTPFDLIPSGLFPLFTPFDNNITMSSQPISMLLMFFPLSSSCSRFASRFLLLRCVSASVLCETPLAEPRIMSRLRKDSVRGDCHVCDHSLGDMVGHAGDSAHRGPCGEWCSLPS